MESCFCKEEDSVLDFAGHEVSFTTSIQFYHCEVKEAVDNM